MKYEVRGSHKVKKGFAYYMIKWTVFLVGLLVLATGGAFMIKSAFGSATWDVLHIGLSTKTSWSIGVWVQIIGLFMIGLACIIDQSKPQIGSFINIILIGFFLDFMLSIPIYPSVMQWWESLLFLIGGICILGFGAGMYVATGLGAGPRDGMTMVLSKKSGLSIRLVRTLLEGTALLIGWLLGGPVAAGTFLSVFLIGPVMQASIGFWRKQLSRLDERDELVEAPMEPELKIHG
ncbi:YczE/YyaS/YitT family protein [Alkalicoccobacillus murimartini]|uniref:Membrane protein YczE n=1 Tax=Alkalicoccobacillus murimartini TaxID=171685 RepID=A0ABT9YIK1_9BACI|nr:membrane protein [Alkalicoccobacillus murimartini]MDQ0207681.1 putative membrane protein YczE [Alkalicoccobacillus murimartini]